MSLHLIGSLLASWATPGSSVPEGPAEPARAVVDRPDGAARKSRLQIGIGGGLVATGIAAQWAAMAGAGALSERPRGDAVPGVVVGSVLGGSMMFEGVLLVGLASRNAGRRAPDDRRRSARLRGVGGAALGVGLATVGATALTWPSLRDGCGLRVACPLAMMHAGTVSMTVGAGLVGWGGSIRVDQPRALDSRVSTPLAMGSALFGLGYLGSLAVGFGTANARRDDVGRRVRARASIPLVGPWWVAAGPDAPWLMAAALAGQGTLQAAGAVALGVAAIRARTGRRRNARVALLPTPGGVTLTGRF